MLHNTGSVIDNGTIYQNVNFVDSPEKADKEIRYDKMGYNKEDNCWLYFYHGYLVATVKGNDAA